MKKSFKRKNGIALILTLGIIFMLGVLAGSFAFFTSISSSNTKQYMYSKTAYNAANSGYHYMIGAIDEFINILVEESVRFNLGLASDASLDSYKDGSLPDNNRITEDQFNQLRACITKYLSGEPIDFHTVGAVAELNVKNGILDTDTHINCTDTCLAYRINYKLFESSNVSSWANKYNFMQSTGGSFADMKYEIDLDGINNYLYITDTVTNKTLPQLYAETLFSSDDTSAKNFTLAHKDDEQYDANWHIITDNETNGKTIARFAVLAKDLSSLINLHDLEMQDSAISQLAASNSGVTSATLVDSLNNTSTDMAKIANMLSNTELASSFTTSSTKSTEHLNLNTSDTPTIYKYLNEAYSSASASTPIKVSHAKTSVNILDYTDSDNIPTFLHKNVFSADDVTAGVWGLSDDDIFAGIEGVRISEVMINPEQVFKFDNLNFTLKTDGSIEDTKDYFYKIENLTVPSTPSIKENFRESEVKIGDFTVDGGNNIKLPTSSPLTVRNPGGPYQFWLKMKITAKNPDKGSNSKSKYSSLKADPDIIVGWASDVNGEDIENQSKVTKVSAMIWTNAAAIASKFEALPDANGFYPVKLGQVVTLNELLSTGTCKSVLEADPTIWIGSDPSSTLSAIKIGDALDPDESKKMNLHYNETTKTRDVVKLTYDNIRGIMDGSEDVDTAIQKYKNEINTRALKTAEELSKYKFGSKVVEVSVFDENAGLSSDGVTPKDELIGIFYCVNTNGFNEDDTHMPKAGVIGGVNSDGREIVDHEWKDEDDDYLWFYSLGVPEWIKYNDNDMPEWMKSQIASGSETLLSESSKGIYNTNLCVFPKDKCNLKFRFRLVNLGDSRFNQTLNHVGTTEKFPHKYKVGIENVTFDPDSSTPLIFDETSDMTTLETKSAITGRPQWINKDEVEIDIKEMVITQQLYETSLKQPALSNNEATLNPDFAALPSTYNKIVPIDEGEGGLIKTVKLKSDVTNKVEDTSLNEMIYYRNQRLENRAANELHAGEYIEIFNGTAQNVNMDGWIMKVEQYKKKSDGMYKLLGPAMPDAYIDYKNATVSGGVLDVSYEVRDIEPQPSYIFLKDATIQSSNKDKNIMPYGVLANNLYSRMEFTDASKIKIDMEDTFQPLFFQDSTNIALGDDELTTVYYVEKNKGKVFFDSAKTTEREEFFNASKPYIKVNALNGINIGGSTNPFYIRQDPYNNGSNKDISWYAVKKVNEVDAPKSQFGSSHEYETFNLIPGYYFCSNINATRYNGIPYCDVFKIWNDQDKGNIYHRNISTFINRDVTQLKNIKGILFEDDTYKKHQNPFKKSPFNNEPFKSLFSDQLTAFDLVQDEYQAAETADNLIALDAAKEKFVKTILFPAFSDTEAASIVSNAITLTNALYEFPESERLAKLTGMWKYMILTEKQREDLLNELYKTGEPICELSFNSAETDKISFPGTNANNVFNYDGSQATTGPGFYPPYYHPIEENKVLGIQFPKKDFYDLTNYMLSNQKFNSVIKAYKTATEYNFTPHKSSDSIFNNMGEKVWILVPILFKAARDPLSTPVYEKKNIGAFNVNAGTAWNLSPEYTPLLKGVNINKVNADSGSMISSTSSFDKTSFSITFEDYKKNPNGIFPVNFRDDADRIVITLFAPASNSTGFNLSDIIENTAVNASITNNIYKNLSSPKLFGDDANGDFGLAQSYEWICSNDCLLDTGIRYGVVDRAVIDRELATPDESSNKDWYAGKAMTLNTFFTDPIKIQKGKPGNINEETPFSAYDPNDLDIVTKYWTPHKTILKPVAGPTPNKWVINANGSPGNHNFPITEQKDPYSKDTVIPSILPVIPSQPKNALSEIISREEYLKQFLDTQDIYDYNHIGFGQDNHHLISFSTNNGAFIKNAPLRSIAELCDIPAPNIENDYNITTQTNPLSAGSLINCFIDGVEDANGNYLTVEQKKKVFSGSSVDSFEIRPASVTDFKFDSASVTASNPLGQENTSVPFVFKANSTNNISVTNFGLRYQFKCVETAGSNKDLMFYPGRYKVFIEGLNYKQESETLWDIFSLIILLPDNTISVVSKNSTSDFFDQINGGFIGGTSVASKLENLTVEDGSQLRADHIVQIMPASGGEYFNIQNYLEVNFFCDPSSSKITELLSSSTAPTSEIEKLKWLVQLLQSYNAFSQIKIHLIPEEGAGKLNINTASPQALLRLPGFYNAIDPTLNSSEGYLKRTAAKEVFQDIMTYLHPEQDLSRTFTDAGDFLTAMNLDSGTPRKTHRMFPVTGDDVVLPPDAPTGGLSVDEKKLLREMMSREKLKLFRTALPYLQFESSSFQITSLGQAVSPVPGSTTNFIVHASQKVQVDINLTDTLNTLRDKYVYGLDSFSKKVTTIGNGNGNNNNNGNGHGHNHGHGNNSFFGDWTWWW